MRLINIESKTYAYIIIKDFFLKPLESGVLDDTGLVESEYRSLLKLCDSNSVIISNTDYEYIKTKAYASTQGYDDGELRLLISEKISNEDKGVTNGVASLDDSGKVPSIQLPSYVDDVLEFDTLSDFPISGERGKIYIDKTTNITYRWGGSTYIKITSGEVSSVAGKTGVVSLVKGDVGLSNVDNTTDASKNVLSATKWTTARTFTFTGGATGSVSFNGSQDTSVNLTVDLSSTLKTNDYRIDNWELASTNSHTHSNKSVLDATTASYTTAEKTKLSGIATGANNFALPTGVSGQVLKHNGTAWVAGSDNDTTYVNATTSASGLMSASDKTKLDSLSKITIVQLTQAEYDALSITDKMKADTLYAIVG